MSMSWDDERKQMEAAGFSWDPAERLTRTYIRWTNLPKDITALRQPHMTDAQWEQHKLAKIAEANAIKTPS